MRIEIPEYKVLEVEFLVVDYNGTIAVDGKMPETIKERLVKLSKELKIHVLTADTHGNAREECKDIPVEIRTFSHGNAVTEKDEIVENLGRYNCVCMGNGRNDLLMCRMAALSIAVLDAEGMYGKLIREADVCVRSMEEGLDLLLNPKRLVATLRG